MVPSECQSIFNVKMSEKLCLQWNDFQDNLKGAFGSLRENTDFADVTLACEDGDQIEAHKVILAASSPLFQEILKRNKHSHPLIYMRGVKSEVMLAILDFLYFGEANLFQENLDSFLVIAEELHLQGLIGTKTLQIVPNGPIKSQERENADKEQEASLEKYSESTANSQMTPHESDTFSGTVVLASDFVGDIQDFGAKVNLMMEKTSGKNSYGKPLYRCTVCGKEERSGNLKIHIEANHLEGISIPCNFCQHIAKSRHGMIKHKIKNHKNQTKFQDQT